MKKWLLFLFISVSAIVSATAFSMPNPASVYCVHHGGRLEMINGLSGVTGVCIFPDKSYCEEWSYLRGICKPNHFYLPEKIKGANYCLTQLPNKNLVIYLYKS
jgi:putative hemolysin